MGKRCTECGNLLNDTAKFCVACGAAQNQPMTNQADGAIPNEPAEEETGRLDPRDAYYGRPQEIPAQPTFFIPPVGQRLSYKQFYDLYAPKNVKNLGIALGIIALISGAVSIANLVFSNFIALIDIVFYVTMGILLLTTKKWGLALAVTIYSGFFSLIAMAISGVASGIVALMVGIFATINLQKISRAYKQYLATGQITREMMR